MKVGYPRPLEFVPARARLERYAPEAYPGVEEWAWQKLYRVDTDEVWTVVGEDDAPYWLTLGPEADLGIGAAFSGLRPRTGESVIVDLATARVTQLFPFPVEVYPWSASGHPVIRIPPSVATATRAGNWTQGIYELDLSAGTARLISTTTPFRGQLVVAGSSALGAGVLEWRVNIESGSTTLVFHPDDGSGERTIAAGLGSVDWSPDGRLVALQWSDRRVSIYDSHRDAMIEIEAGESGVPARWSLGGRYFVLERARPTIIVDTAGLASESDVTSLRILGPFTDAIFADWGPGPEPTEALLLGEYCAPDGFRLDRLDLTTGQRTRIPTTVGGFWVYDWSPRGDLIAVSSWEIDGGFTLIDAVTGMRAERPRLDSAVTSMQDVSWSASGEWIALVEIGGRDRCAV